MAEKGPPAPTPKPGKTKIPVVSQTTKKANINLDPRVVITPTDYKQGQNALNPPNQPVHLPEQLPNQPNQLLPPLIPANFPNQQNQPNQQNLPNQQNQLDQQDLPNLPNQQDPPNILDLPNPLVLPQNPPNPPNPPN